MPKIKRYIAAYIVYKNWRLRKRLPHITALMYKLGWNDIRRPVMCDQCLLTCYACEFDGRCGISSSPGKCNYYQPQAKALDEGEGKENGYEKRKPVLALPAE
jgi:hypothetical protein